MASTGLPHSARSPGAASIPSAHSILAQAREENFPVAAWFLPQPLRRHLSNIYGFARMVDDLGDEASGDREALLDWLGGELDAIFALANDSGPGPEHPLMRRLATTVSACTLPRQPFDRLIQANRRDQHVRRYQTFQDLRGYCALSAEPVGELVLRVGGAATPGNLSLSNDVCTGLQLVEFWQDLGEDARMGRVYLPVRDLERFGYSVEDLMAGRANGAFRSLMRFESARTRDFLLRGRPLARRVGGRLGIAIRLFTAGGLAALADLERRRFATFSSNAHASHSRRALAAAVEAFR